MTEIMNDRSSSLLGKEVLILEDEVFIAADIERVLAIAGAAVTVCATAAEGLRMVGAVPFDCGILDINLGDGTSYKVADHLRRQGTPFVFTTGYDQVRADFADVPIFQKPFDQEALVRMVALMATS
jgi:DNA-binding response OmpR family regulator